MPLCTKTLRGMASQSHCASPPFVPLSLWSVFLEGVQKEVILPRGATGSQRPLEASILLRCWSAVEESSLPPCPLHLIVNREVGLAYYDVGDYPRVCLPVGEGGAISGGGHGGCSSHLPFLARNSMQNCGDCITSFNRYGAPMVDMNTQRRRNRAFLKPPKHHHPITPTTIHPIHSQTRTGLFQKPAACLPPIDCSK